MSERVIRRVLIRGRVQGVGYRDWTSHVARDRGLEGWVRNRRDGQVEAVFAGPMRAVGEMIAACRRGPAAARVESVEEEAAVIADLDLRHPNERFSVLPTV